MVKSTLACGLQECLSKEWMGDNFRDFRVVVDGSEYFCHKFILSACSTFFKTLLSSDFREKKEECVELKNMSKETFDVIINAIYKGVDGLTLDNIISVWQATHMLDIPFLLEECERFVSKNMSRDNFVEFYEIAKLLNAEKIISLAIRFIKENFETFCATKTFLELSFPLLFSLVDDDSLVVKTEDLVLKSIIDWVSYTENEPGEIKGSVTEQSTLPLSLIDTGSEDATSRNENDSVDPLDEEGQNTDVGVEHKSTHSSSLHVIETLDRKKFLVELLSTARIFLAGRSHLEKLLIHPLIKSCDEAHEIVYEALLYQWRSVSFPSNFVIPYRNCSGKRNVMAFVRDWKIHFLELRSHQIYMLDLDFNLGNPNIFWRSLPPFELASIGSTLCFVYFSDSTECEQTKQKQHRCITKNIAIIDSEKNISNLRQICGNSQLHITSLKDVFVSITDGTFVPKMPESVFSCVDFTFFSTINSVCVFEDNILLFCDTFHQPKVQCYNIYRPTKLSELKHFNGPIDNIISITKGREMYILQMNGALSFVNMIDDKIQITFVIQLWTESHWRLNGAVYYKNELIIFYKEKNTIAESSILKSLPKIFERISVTEIKSQSNLVPLVVPESWWRFNNYF